jgi:SUF system NifU family Fe-S assembly protein
MSATASADITSLYQEVIIDHARRPRNFRQLEGASQRVEAVNPLCGDQLTLYIQLADGAIADIAFEGNGCAISQASASLMTMAMKGLRQEAALALFTRVHTMRVRGRCAAGRGRQAGGSLGCVGVPDAGQMRHLGLAGVAQRP